MQARPLAVLALAVLVGAGAAACSGSPSAGSGSPSAGSGLPGAGSGLPGAGSGLPGAGSGLPGAGLGPPSPAGPGQAGSTPSAFAATVTALPAAVVAEMTGVSWRPGCPLGLSQLRLVRLVYWGFDGAAHWGELVAHADLAQAMVRVFGKLYDARFPFRMMLRIDAFGGDDHASMAADNTSMFNCRRAEGSTSWSRHAYGRAIDVNTVENPYVRGGTILPPAGAAYLDRANVRAGMIVAGDVVVRAFAAEGFRWGGHYPGLKDYQHFEKLA